MKIEDIPKDEWDLLGKGIKYPENEEWDDEYYNLLLKSAISIWKQVTPTQRKKWKKSRSGEFLKYIGPSLSDDDWDYIQPHYTYMSMESIMRTSAKFFGPIMKKVIIQSVWDKGDDFKDDFSFDARDAWDAIATGRMQDKSSTYKDLYQSGHVTRQFAEIMKPYKNDDEAWEAIDLFYESGAKVI